MPFGGAFVPVSGGEPLSCNIEDYPGGIVLPIDKPYRWTSADVIRKVKFAAIRHFHKKNLKVGHAGTLDPLATGVLLVCIGNATKQAQSFQDHDKEYLAGIMFGATTPSYDREKDIDRRFPYEHISEESVAEVLPSFLGTHEQIAPLFSAKSVDGVRAYEMARRMYKQSAGTSSGDFDAAALSILQKSMITIHSISLESFVPSTLPTDVVSPKTVEDTSSSASSRINVIDTSALGLPVATVRIACSKGTYIRAFARDIGEALGSGAFLNSLCRTRTGEFSIENSLSLDSALRLLAD
jgi:tRNA pseudouridine55 synthase